MDIDWALQAPVADSITHGGRPGTVLRCLCMHIALMKIGPLSSLDPLEVRK